MLDDLPMAVTPANAGIRKLAAMMYAGFRTAVVSAVTEQRQPPVR